MLLNGYRIYFRLRERREIRFSRRRGLKSRKGRKKTVLQDAFVKRMSITAASALRTGN